MIALLQKAAYVALLTLALLVTVLLTALSIRAGGIGWLVAGAGLVFALILTSALWQELIETDEPSQEPTR